VHNASVLDQDVASITNAAATVSGVSIAVDSKGHVSLSYDKAVTWPDLSSSQLNAVAINQQNGMGSGIEPGYLSIIEQ
jgi:hypothetical protein